MPYVVNGIGTWYYGKDRIHRLKGSCAFCNSLGELESYNTTLYLVVLFVPLLPLGRKRILEQCPACGKHRVLSLKEWEKFKADDIAKLLEDLDAEPGNRDTLLRGIGLAIGYQDEELFDKLARSLAKDRRDADIQAQLGLATATSPAGTRRRPPSRRRWRSRTGPTSAISSP